MNQQREDRIGRLVFNQIFGLAGLAFAVWLSRDGDVLWSIIAGAGFGAFAAALFLGQLIVPSVPERYRVHVVGIVVIGTLLGTLALVIELWPIVVFSFAYGMICSALVTFMRQER